MTPPPPASNNMYDWCRQDDDDKCRCLLQWALTTTAAALLTRPAVDDCGITTVISPNTKPSRSCSLRYFVNVLQTKTSVCVTCSSVVRTPSVLIRVDPTFASAIKDTTCRLTASTVKVYSSALKLGHVVAKNVNPLCMLPVCVAFAMR